MTTKMFRDPAQALGGFTQRTRFHEACSVARLEAFRCGRPRRHHWLSTAMAAPAHRLPECLGVHPQGKPPGMHPKNVLLAQHSHSPQGCLSPASPHPPRQHPPTGCLSVLVCTPKASRPACTPKRCCLPSIPTLHKAVCLLRPLSTHPKTGPPLQARHVPTLSKTTTHTPQSRPAPASQARAYFEQDHDTHTSKLTSSCKPGTLSVTAVVLPFLPPVGRTFQVV